MISDIISTFLYRLLYDIHGLSLFALNNVMTQSKYEPVLR